MIQRFHFWVFYLKKTKTLTQKDKYAPIFTTAFIIIAKIQKLPKYPLIDEWTKKMWFLFHTHMNINQP